MVQVEGGLHRSTELPRGGVQWCRVHGTAIRHGHGQYLSGEASIFILVNSGSHMGCKAQQYRGSHVGSHLCKCGLQLLPTTSFPGNLVHVSLQVTHVLLVCVCEWPALSWMQFPSAAPWADGRRACYVTIGRMPQGPPLPEVTQQHTHQAICP